MEMRGQADRAREREREIVSVRRKGERGRARGEDIQLISRHDSRKTERRGKEGEGKLLSVCVTNRRRRNSTCGTIFF